MKDTLRSKIRLSLPHSKETIIERFFSNTGETYDEVVHRFTLGIDRLWKKQILQRIAPHPSRVLDIACGTGILTFAIAQKYPQSHVVGVDISNGYLEVAERKRIAMKVSNVTFYHCKAEDFTTEERFDAVTTSYLPKYAEIDILVRNISKMLSPGGRVIFHDFTYPTNHLLQIIFEMYFKVIQRIGLYPEWREVFFDLPDLIRESRWVPDLTQALAREGLIEITVESLTLQGAALVTAQKDLTPQILPLNVLPKWQ